MSSIWKDAEVVSIYTRAQALEDGVLVAADPELAREAGYTAHVAMTAAVWSIVEPTEDEERLGGQSFTDRLWDVLFMARFSRQRISVERRRFSIIFWMHRPEYRGGRPGQVTMQLDMVASLDENGEPCATFMLPTED